MIVSCDCNNEKYFRGFIMRVILPKQHVGHVYVLYKHKLKCKCKLMQILVFKYLVEVCFSGEKE